ncbi:MAG: hypothetical protein R3F54_17810 [Alphaproteobacteria bacterium]
MLVGSEPGEKRCGSHDRGHVAMPSVPGSRLAVIEIEIIFGAQEAFLDGPSQTGCAGDVGKRRAFERMDEIVSGRLEIAFVQVADDESVTRPSSGGRMEIMIGTDRRVIVGADVDAGALARVLEVLRCR